MNWQKNISPSQYFSGGYDNIQVVVDENGKSDKALNRRQLSPTKQTHCAKVPLIEQSILHKIYIRSNPECKHSTVAI